MTNHPNRSGKMRGRITAASALVSDVYRTANSLKNGVVWGFSVERGSGRVVNEVGAYRDAVRARREAISEIARAMAAPPEQAPPISSASVSEYRPTADEIEAVEALARRNAEAREREWQRKQESGN